jgi:DNA-binding transcriptional MerR regulator
MDTHQYMSISAFSRLSGVSRKALIFYDSIGLFRPAHVGENGYRYYHHLQLDTITVIQSLKELGMSLDEIKRYLGHRTPEGSLQLFRRQRQAIREKMERLERLSGVIEYRIQRIQRALTLDADAIELVHREAAPIFISASIRCPERQITDEMWIRFFDECDLREIPYGLPVGYCIDRDSLSAGNYDIISHFFIQTGDSEKATAQIPGGTYLVGYLRGYHRRGPALYERLLAYAGRAGLQVTGDAYEELLLDEISASDPQEYLAQVSIQVTPRETTAVHIETL